MDQTALKPGEGGPVPLFDRLVDDQPMELEEAVPLRVYRTEQVMASVQRELHRLCNTRSYERFQQWESRQRTVLNYGIPCIASLSPSRKDDVDLLMRFLEKAVIAYEPRLRRVVLTPGQPSRGRFAFQMDADLIIGNTVQAISFPLAV